jgi:hypothetical protein
MLVGYSVAMTTLTAPDLTPGYPSKGPKLGPAWNALYRALARGEDFQDGRVLAHKIAPKHDLDPATLVALLSRAAKAGILDKEPRPVMTQRGFRSRTHYRVHADA